MSSQIVTAAMIVIGDEILSGRTRDKNAHHLAKVLTAAGIELREVRMIPDDRQVIIEAINQLRYRCDYVFTSGGIGPTHDDITAEAVAAAFDLAFGPDKRALSILTAHYRQRSLPFTDARKRMAMMPAGAMLIDNPVTAAPGFIIHNVHVMAGVPEVFQAMLDHVLPTLRSGRTLLSQSVECALGEGTVGDALAEIQKAHPDTMIGSYPRHANGHHTTQIVIRSASSEAVDAAKADVEAMVKRVGGE